MRVLVTCEYSGTVRDAFTTLGHDAMSCDLLPSDTPGRHHQGDMFALDLASYDLVIAHPPCTAVCVSGNRHYSGTQARIAGAEFVRRIWSAPIARLAIENPVGVLNRLVPELPKPQYIQPWQFGHGETKKTGLWLRGLPPLMPTCIVDGRSNRLSNLPPGPDRWKIRSTTYQGIANAMAAQWSSL